KNFNDYAKYLKKTTKENMEEEYDGKFEIEASVVATEILEEDAKYAALKSASKQYDEAKVILSEEINVSKIKECRRVTVKAYLYEDGADIFSSVQTLELTVVKIGSKWIILDGGMGF
ncbi:MAG: hypothetical protein II329_03065, partial [Clostridia bacterium]|nr:hypothetical protein [Clostridia bacterium]